MTRPTLPLLFLFATAFIGYRDNGRDGNDRPPSPPDGVPLTENSAALRKIVDMHRNGARTREERDISSTCTTRKAATSRDPKGREVDEAAIVQCIRDADT